MWHSLGKWVIRNRFLLLGFLIAVTGLMAWLGSHIQLNYEFAKAIPANHPKYIEYTEFKNKFGEDGNLLVIGIQSEKITQKDVFNAYADLSGNLKAVDGVEDVLSVPFAINLVKDPVSEKLRAVRIFDSSYSDQSALDSAFGTFYNLPFYRGLLYNPQTHAWLVAVRINKDILNSARRTKVVDEVTNAVDKFDKKQNVQSALSGLPLVRTALSTRIANEMKLFLFGSALLSAFILLIFFRSFSATLLSIAVVGTGVIWSLGTMVLLGYKITLLTALIPPLLVVIGIPNCIYFLNKFHFEYRLRGNKNEAIINMVGRMGIVTLFCNIAAAIGFAVFALTRSIILKEFGVVAGINIMLLFVVSFILIPTILSLLPPPKERHTRYIENERLNRWLMRIEKWVFNHKKIVYAATALLLVISITGILKLKSVGYIVDDLPKSDRIYTDLKFFERNFNGVMPLEILVDTKKKYGVSNVLSNLEKIDSLVQFIASKPEFAKPLSVTEGLKFARQAYYDGDSNSYALPNSFDIAFLSPYLRMKGDTTSKNNNFGRLVTSFMDSNRQVARISVNMEDVGSVRLPHILDTLQERSSEIFDSSKYNIQFTGTSVIFLEGSQFIINGLKESIFWAFLLIALCMLYLFRSVRILACSLIPNIIPLAFTAGIMGWIGIPLKPSTVLIFSVALGIAIDVTIRFLVNYKQELPFTNYSVEETVQLTIRHTGISIIYTSLVLIAGFVIFCFSNFGGTQSLGWLTSLTLLVAMVTNLVLLPVLLLILKKEKKLN